MANKSILQIAGCFYYAKIRYQGQENTCPFYIANTTLQIWRVVQLIENAKLIRVMSNESYLNENKEHRKDLHIDKSYVFISYFIDMSGIVPVKMTILTYNDGNSPKAHVVMSLDTIKKVGVVKVPIQNESVISHPTYYTYKLSELLSLVKNNVVNNAISKHIPDEFLNYNSNIFLNRKHQLISLTFQNHMIYYQ